MTDYVYINKGGGGVFRKGQLGPIGQGTVGIDLVVQVLDLDKAAVTLTGFSTITGRLENQANGDVIPIDGTLTLVSSGSTGQFTWVVSANDSGTDGLFWVVFKLTNGTDTYITLPTEMLITDNPAISASSGPPLIGITQAASDWLDDEITAVGAATDGNLLQSDGTNSEDSGIAAADVALKTGATFTGQINFSGTTHAGIKLLSLTTAQRDALTAANGMIIYNTTTGQFEGYDAGWGAIAGGSVAWGAITGTLADQTDLQTALDARQPLDTDLTALAGLSSADSNFIVGSAAGWVVESGATVRASLGLGTLAEQNGAFSGGGEFASGGFVLTVPATGTAALRDVANTFTATNTFNSSVVVPDSLGIVFAGQTNTGFSRPSAYRIAFVSDGATPVRFGRESGDVGMVVSADGYYRWSTTALNASATVDTWLGRPAAATVQMGLNAASPIAQTFQGPGGSGTNIAGANLTVAAGKGTGTGAGGSLNFSTAPIGASGSSANALVTAVQIDDEPAGTEITRLLLLDLSDGTLKRVVFGADNSGGAGLKLLAVAN